MIFIITAGGTREYIDPVRFISNASSGRMGYSLAQSAVRNGHKVTLITAPTALKPPKNANVIEVETSQQMFEAVKKNFGKCDCLIMAAAVSDYKPKKTYKKKIKKSMNEMVVTLKPTKDILKWAGKNKKKQIVVGFALEDKSLRKNAEEKLKKKKLDMIVANNTKAISAEKSTVQIKTPDSDWIKIPLTTKPIIAGKILKLTQALINNKKSEL